MKNCTNFWIEARWEAARLESPSSQGGCDSLQKTYHVNQNGFFEIEEAARVRRARVRSIAKGVVAATAVATVAVKATALAMDLMGGGGLFSGLVLGGSALLGACTGFIGGAAS